MQKGVVSSEKYRCDMAFTQNEIKGLKAKESAYYSWDDNGTRGGGRLGIKVYPSKSKVFVFRYYLDKKRVFIQLGKFPTLSLADAREEAKKYGLQLKQGIDPKEFIADTGIERKQAKQEEARKGSIEQLFNAYVAQMKKDGKRTYAAVINSLEKEVYSFIDQKTKAKNVTTHDLVLILAGMIKRGAVTQSNRVRSYLMAAFNYGLKHDNDPANFIDEAKFGLTFNPVSAIPKQKGAEKVGDHYLSSNEVNQLLADLQHERERFQMGDSVRNLISLCFFTGGQRPYELAASKWSAVDWEQKTILIISDVSKNKRPHIVPLTDSALAVLESQQGFQSTSEFIFPHRFDDNQHMRMDSLSRGIARYRKDTPTIRPFIPRDIRRTCKTLMGELGISKSIRDRLQNHALNDVSSKHYDRYEYLPEKLSALRTWEAKLLDTYTDNVINLKRAL